MKIAFYDTRPYDMLWFDPLLKEADMEPQYIENRLSCGSRTRQSSEGSIR